MTVTAALLVATTAAWDDNQRRTPYSSGQPFGDLNPATRESWLADTHAAVVSYLRVRRDAEHARNGQSSRWWALAWEIEQLEAETPR